MMNKQTDATTLWRLFKIYLLASTFTFAGGLAMLPIIQRDVIDKYHMMDEDNFIEYAALSQTLPGVIALNNAVFVGKHVAGIWGALCAGFGAVLPAFVGMMLVTILFKQIAQMKGVESALNGIRAASAALILSSAVSMGKKAIKNSFGYIVTAIVLILVLFFNADAVYVVVAAGVVGILYAAIVRKSKKVSK